MKSINFKRKESVLRSVELTEQKLVKRRLNWDRIVYLVILTIALLFGARYLINHFLFLDGNGQVLFDSVDIRNTTDCRVVKFFVEEGDSVKKGDPLFKFTAANQYGAFTDPNNPSFFSTTEKKSNEDVSWAERQIFSTQQEIKMFQIQLKAKNDLKQQLTNELERMRNAVALDALPSYKLEDQITRIQELDVQMNDLKSRIGVLQANLGSLNGMIRDLGMISSTTLNGNSSGFGGNGADPKNVFYSPLDGTITNMMKKEFEVALKSESILSIHKPKNVYIKAFFKQEDLRWLKEGQIVTLEFPDGTESMGIIRRFYFSTYRLPEEFQKKYEPTTRSLSADIYPIKTSDLSRWKMYWKMAVKITKYKYN